MKVLITGGGIIGRNHAQALARLPQAELVAVAEPSAEAAAQFGVKTFASQAEALAQADVDLVVICTPSGTHADLATEALHAGKHVVVEKPLDVSLPRALALAALAASLPAQVFSVISQHRFDPGALAVASAVAQGDLGVITSATATVPWWRPDSYYDLAQWRGTSQMDGGSTMNQGIHTIDLLRMFLGDVTDVTAFTARLAHSTMETEDVTAAAIRFASGSLATFHSTTAAYPGQPVRVQVHGTRGSAIISDDDLIYLGSADLAPLPKSPDAFVLGHLRQYEDVLAAVRDKRPPAVTAGDGVQALAIVTALYRSAATGCAVSLSSVLGER
jgi:predicted dehydrogenase